MMGFMVLIVMLSKPVMALELNSFAYIPLFSIVIGDNIYTLDYANDLKNANQISDALIKSQGDIFIKIDDNGWIKNSDGKQVNKESVKILSIKFSNGKEIRNTIGEPSKDTSGTSVTAKVYKIQFASIITKTGTNTATFKYKVLYENGTDITKAVPASEISAIASVSSSIVLDPLTGTGNITFNSYSDTDKSYIVTLVDNVTGIVAMINSKDLEVINNNDTRDSGIINNSDTKDLHVIHIDTRKLTKTGSNTATFKYKILNKSDIDITKIIPASRIGATASVSSTIALDPSTATGTITYNLSTDVDKEINISLVDKVTGSTVFSTMSTSEIVPSEPVIKGTKVSKITINSTQLGIASNGPGYATYSIYDEVGNDITSSSLSDTVTFKSQVGTIVARRGLLTLTPNAGISFSTLNSVVITGSDSITGVSMSATLIVPIVL
jgi:hypothetical protein